MRTVFFTVGSGRYEIFALPYAISVLHHNPDCAVEIIVDHLGGFQSRYGRGQSLLSEAFGDRLLIRSCDFDNRNPQKARFLLVPEIKAEFAYIGDIDILVLEGGVSDWHVAKMRESGMPYSNELRPNSFRLTGLHFTRYDAHYPLPDLGPLIPQRLKDEELLYEIVRQRGHLPAPQLGRPVHGIHFSPNRNVVSFDHVDWHASEPRWLAYQAFTKSDLWRALGPTLAPEYRDLLSRLEAGCSAAYGDRKVEAEKP